MRIHNTRVQGTFLCVLDAVSDDKKLKSPDLAHAPAVGGLDVDLCDDLRQPGRERRRELPRRSDLTHGAGF